MATDREGNTINVGDRVVLVPKIASLNGQKVVLGNRDPIKVDGEDVLIEAELGGGGGVTDHGALTGRSDPDHPAGAIAFTATDLLLGRSTAGAGAGEEVPCTAVGRALLAAVSAAAQRTALDIAAEFLKLDASNGPLTGDLLIDGGTLAAFKAVIGGEQIFDLYNSASSGVSGVLFKIRTRSGSSGDAWFRFENASRYFTVGLDTSEDEFRIGTGAVLGSGNLLRLTSAGVLHVVGTANFGGDVVLGSTLSGSFSLIVDSAFSQQADVELRQGGLTNARLALLAGGGFELQVDGSGLGTPAAIFAVTTGNLLDMKAKRVTNAADPTSAQDVATKAYVDAEVPTIGTGAGEVADGEAVAAAWQIVWREHFAEIEAGLWNNVSTGTANAFLQDAGGISALDSVVGWGWARVHCGTSTGTGSYAYFVLDEVNNLGRMLASTGDWRVRFRLCTPNDNNLKASWGLTNVAPTTLRPTNSLMFEADVGTSTNIRAITYDGTTTNNTDTGQTVASIEIGASGAPRWFEIRCRSGNVQFFIDGSSVATFTTNLPTAANSYFVPFFFCQEAGSTFRGLLVDYIDLAMPSEWMAGEGY